METRSIPFAERTVTDDTIPEGESSITTRGVRGTKTLTYRITYAAGKQISKKLIKTVVTRKPVTQIRTVGTMTSEPSGGSGCDPNYSGCVPIASDVDCAGGSGNGPEYVEGPVEVTGSDVYGLDRDNDGIGCED